MILKTFDSGTEGSETRPHLPGKNILSYGKLKGARWGAKLRLHPSTPSSATYEALGPGEVCEPPQLYCTTG